MRFTLRELAQISGGRLHGDPELAFAAIATDTRALPAGALFAAIAGERFDGNDFAAAACAQGASAALLSRESAAAGLPAAVVVPDTVAALAALARVARARFTGPVIAITGSNGKTTTKELCAEILQRAGRRVRKTPGNLNNHIGLPLSILALEEGDEVLVVELGMNHAGEIAALAAIASPTVGAITHVGAAHLGPLGSLEAIARAKGELLEELRPDGAAVLNADDPQLVAQAPRFAGRRVWFGTAAHADYRAEPSGPRRFRLHSPHGSTPIELALPGPHLVVDALCAAAAAAQSGLLGAEPLLPIRAALEAFRGLPGRLSLREAPAGLRVLDDCYNANPSSVRAALATLRELAGAGRSFVLLGDMLELGPQEQALHADIGRAVAESGAHGLIGVGPLCAHAVSAARAAGIAFAERAADPAAAGQLALAQARPGEVVLVKGSRGSRMEGAVTVLMGSSAAPHGAAPHGAPHAPPQGAAPAASGAAAAGPFESALVLGAGRSGRAAVSALRSLGARRIAVYDRSAAALEDLPPDVERISAPALPDFAPWSAVVQSPGIAVPADPRIVPEIDLAAQLLRAPLIGITGSNGKSTTSELIGAMLRAGGLRAPVAGNIGTALSTAIDEPAEWVVVELSSFQLEHSRRFHARIAVLLNLAEDHLDRHGSLTAYGAAKARLAELQNDPGAVLVFNQEDEWAAGVARRSRARTVAFALGESRHPDAVTLRGDAIELREEGQTVARFALAELSAASRAPVSNALAALAAARAAGVGPAALARALAQFPGLPHRSVLVCVRRGVRFVNDSKATNPAAAAASLRAIGGPIWWLAGGRNKGLDFAPLASAASDVRGALLFGEAASELESALAGRVPTERVGRLGEALERAASRASAGDTVLLAPACASFDQFRSFEERGEHFAELARRLPC